jgi:transcriptional regulator with XRE-family HTH domain
MSSKEKEEFAARMNEVADLLEIPKKGKNRQKSFGNLFSVSQEAARKWLEGESFPSTEKAIQIAKRANVNFEWLMTGRGPTSGTGDALSADAQEKISEVFSRLQSAILHERAHLELWLKIKKEGASEPPVDNAVDPVPSQQLESQPERRGGEEDRRKVNLGFDPERRHYFPAPKFPQKTDQLPDRRRKTK